MSLKFYLRWVFCTSVSLKISFLLESKHAGEKYIGKSFDGGIVLTGYFIEFISFDTDPVLAALQLRLECQEILISLQIRVLDRKSGVRGKSGSVRVDLGGRGSRKKKKNHHI